MARTKHSLRKAPAGARRTGTVVPKSEAQRDRANAGPTKKQLKEAASEALEAGKANARVGDYYITTRNDKPRYVVYLMSHGKGGPETKWRMIAEGLTPADAITSRTIPYPTQNEIDAIEDRAVVAHFGHNILEHGDQAAASFRLARRTDGNEKHYYWKKLRAANEQGEERPKKAISEAQRDRSEVLRLVAAELNNGDVYIPIQNQQKVASAIATSLKMNNKSSAEKWRGVLKAIRADSSLITDNTPEDYLLCKGQAASNRPRRAKRSEEVIVFVNRGPELIIEQKAARAKTEKAASSPKKAPAKKAGTAKATGGAKKASAKATGGAKKSPKKSGGAKAAGKVDIRLESAAERLEEAVGAAVIAASGTKIQSQGGDKVNVTLTTGSKRGGAAKKAAPSKAKTPSPAKAAPSKAKTPSPPKKAKTPSPAKSISAATTSAAVSPRTAKKLELARRVMAAKSKLND